MVWETGARWDMGADLPLQEGIWPPVIPPHFGAVSPCSATAEDQHRQACLLMRVTLDAWENLERTSGESSSAILGKARGPQDIEGRRGREDLTWGSCRTSCFYFFLAIACLFTSALPCHAMPCFSRNPLFLFLSVPWRMEWKDDQVLSMFCTLVTLASRSPPPPQH